jgi:hypothetical protein
MMKSRTFLVPAAFAALIAAPALALDLSADLKLGAAPADMTTVKAVDDSAFVGNEVRTKDQIVVGQVETVYESNEGPVALITLNADFASKSSVKSFTVPLGTDTAADGALTLGWTESELIAAVSSNIDATSPAEDDSADGSKDNSGG